MRTLKLQSSFAFAVSTQPHFLNSASKGNALRLHVENEKQDGDLRHGVVRARREHLLSSLIRDFLDGGSQQGRTEDRREIVDGHAILFHVLRHSASINQSINQLVTQLINQLICQSDS